MSLVSRAMRFAAVAHDGQYRKYTGEDYWYHCKNVAALVEAADGDYAQVAAAWLHDTLEDTPVTYADIDREFGKDVADLVVELTDVYTKKEFPFANRMVRKGWETERLSRVSDRAKTIKICDIADNTRDIVENDPKFSIIYLKEKAAMLEVLT